MSDRSTESPATTRDLRIFGITFAASFGVVVGIVVPLVRRHPFASWPWIIAAIALLLAAAVPEALRGFHSVSMRVGHAVGAIQSRIVLTIVFYLVITPFGLLLRMKRKVPRIEHDALTYRVPSEPRAKESLLKPF
jgi:hypothetical protein